MMYTKKAVFFVLSMIMFFGGCSIDEAPQEEKEQVKHAKTLTFFLIDVSKSFNREISGNNYFRGKNFFEMSCDQIIDHIKNAKPGEKIIVRRVGYNSWGDNGIITSFNYADEATFFSEPNPNDPFRLNKWKERKKAFEDRTLEIATKRKENAIARILKFKKYSVANPLEKTDMNGAISSTHFDLQIGEYNNYNKNIVIYSDLKRINSPLTTKKLSFKDANVYVKFIDDKSFKSGQTSTHELAETFSSANSFTTYSVIKSIKNTSL